MRLEIQAVSSYVRATPRGRHFAPRRKPLATEVLADAEIVGRKFRLFKTNHLAGCTECEIGQGCWEARTQATIVVRVRAVEEPATDGLFHLGRRLRCTMVAPDKWQVRAWTMGAGNAKRDADPGNWHKIEGLVWECDLGAEAR